jgi:hypothetical protein
MRRSLLLGATGVVMLGLMAKGDVPAIPARTQEVWASPTSKETVVFSFAGDDQKSGTLWLRPYTAPIVGFRVTKGLRPDRGPLNCIPRVSARTRRVVEDGVQRDYNYAVEELLCEGPVVLEMTDVLFGR